MRLLRKQASMNDIPKSFVLSHKGQKESLTFIKVTNALGVVVGDHGYNLKPPDSAAFRTGAIRNLAHQIIDEVLLSSLKRRDVGEFLRWPDGTVFRFEALPNRRLYFELLAKGDPISVCISCVLLNDLALWIRESYPADEDAILVPKVRHRALNRRFGCPQDGTS